MSIAGTLTTQGTVTEENGVYTFSSSGLVVITPTESITGDFQLEFDLQFTDGTSGSWNCPLLFDGTYDWHIQNESYSTNWHICNGSSDSMLQLYARSYTGVAHYKWIRENGLTSVTITLEDGTEYFISKKYDSDGIITSLRIGNCDTSYRNAGIISNLYFGDIIEISYENDLYNLIKNEPNQNDLISKCTPVGDKVVMKDLAGSYIIFSNTYGLIGDFELEWKTTMQGKDYIHSSIAPILLDTDEFRGYDQCYRVMFTTCNYNRGCTSITFCDTTGSGGRDNRGTPTEDPLLNKEYKFKVARKNGQYLFYMDDVLCNTVDDPYPDEGFYLGWFLNHGGRNYSASCTIWDYKLTYTPYSIYQDPTLEIIQVDNTLTANATVDENLEDKTITYLWNTGATTQSIDITESGTYSCTVTDSVGNSVTQSIDAEYIEPIHEPTVTISRSGYVLKANATIDERLEDQTVTYLWNTGETSKSITVNETGNYTCTITDSLGQTASASYYIVVEYDPVALISADKKTCLCGEKITLSGCNSYCQGSEITSYLWSTGDTTDTIEVKPEDTTIYTLTVTALNGRSSVASVKIDVVTGEIELMKYLPQYWHENAEMQQIQKKTLNYLLFNLQYSSNIITTEAFIGTANNERLSEWERDLGIIPAETIEERRENILAFFKRKGKLNEQIIKEMVDYRYTGATCDVSIENSAIKIIIYPAHEEDVNFDKIYNDLYWKKPAHLGFGYSRYYCTWGDIKDNFNTWNDVKNKGSWNSIKLYLPYLYR